MSPRLPFRAVGALAVLGTTLACRADTPAPTRPDPTPAPRLIVAAIVPNVGSSGGGAPVHVAGTGIHPRAVVTFGGIPVPVETPLGYQVGVRFVAVTPAHAVGPVDVGVINPDGQVVVLPGAYTYAAPSSFDFEGEWSGESTSGETPREWHGADVHFRVRDGLVVSVRCGEQPTLTLARPPAIQDGRFAYSAPDGVSVTGRIVSPHQAIGTMSLGQCGQITWKAEKTVGEGVGR